jgi:ubiquinone/menaquinone biosynthesis C-methylase UbiE
MKAGILKYLPPSAQHETETVLRAHPGVREAAVVLWESEKPGKVKLVGYVVPDEDYIHCVLGGGDEERKRMQKWRKTFDLSQFGKQEQRPEPGFNIAGWNSSYTRQPIPAEHMREWVDLTVQELLSFRAREILEIGCGTGLLLLHLARGCERYVGVDFSAAGLKRIKEQMQEMGGLWNGVSLLERSAENFDGFAENSFDTVILNSVVKYFPSAAYLIGVLEGALRVVKPGGKIFIGDVRNLALLEPYAVSIELYQAQASMGLDELRERVHRRVRFEEQLVIAPEFFLALQKRFPKITRVEVHPKRGRFDNEMTRFRYNAILHLQSERDKNIEPSFLDWAEQRLSLDSIAGVLQNKRQESLAIKSVANARIERDVEALAKLAEAESVRTIEEFRESLEKGEQRGIDPEKMWALGEELGYHVDISWTASRPDGSYDVVFRKPADNGALLWPDIAWPQTYIDLKEMTQYTNIPGRGVLREKLIEQLLEYSQQNLPKNLAPTLFFLIDALPLTADGQVDVREFPTVLMQEDGA